MSVNGFCPTRCLDIPAVRRATNWRQALWGGWTCTRCGAELDRFGRRIGQAGVPQRTVSVDSSTTSDRPAGLALAEHRLRHLEPDLYRPSRRFREAVGLEFPLRAHFREQMLHGDANAAVVVGLGPLRVAAYSTLFDRVVLLAFADELDLPARHGLRAGTALVTANLYGGPQFPDADLFLPPHAGRWTRMSPLIADFLADDQDRLAALRRLISPDEYDRARRLGARFLRDHPGLARDGRPRHADKPVAGDPPR